MNAKTMPSYSHEHVVHIINPHFQTLASDIRKLFRGLNIIDLVRGVRAYDQMHVLNPSYYVLFSSIEDSNRAVNAATHSIRNCSVIVEAAPDGAYKLKEDNSGFVKRLERKLLAQREDMLEQSSQWPNKTVHQVESDASTPQCAVIPQFLASTATGFDNGAEHYRAGHYMRIQEHSYAPPLIRGIASEPAKNHYDKAPWVFGSHEERKHGYEIYLHNQNFARYMTRELDFRRRAAERQPVQFGAIGEPDTRTLEIQVNTAVRPCHGDWNLRGKSGKDPKENVITEEQWYDFDNDRARKMAMNLVRRGTLAARISHGSGVCDRKRKDPFDIVGR